MDYESSFTMASVRLKQGTHHKRGKEAKVANKNHVILDFGFGA